MTPEAQRTAIAEEVSKWRTSHGGSFCAFVGDTDHPAMQGIFDPLIDLNAMQYAVLTQPKMFREQFQDALFAYAEECGLVIVELDAGGWAEVFIKIIGKWDIST